MATHGWAVWGTRLLRMVSLEVRTRREAGAWVPPRVRPCLTAPPASRYSPSWRLSAYCGRCRGAVQRFAVVSAGRGDFRGWFVFVEERGSRGVMAIQQQVTADCSVSLLRGVVTGLRLDVPWEWDPSERAQHWWLIAEASRRMQSGESKAGGRIRTPRGRIRAPSSSCLIFIDL